VILDASHPASPAAPEAPIAQPSATLSLDREPARAAPRLGEETYTCPMHRDVRRPAPGRCPRCGMMLERTGETGAAGDRHAH
jgi:Cu+-exporting ATPase